MDPLLWWAILLCLIVLITLLSLHLCYAVFGDYCRRSEINSASTTLSNPRRLNKYKFQRTEVEDLTSIEKDLESFSPKISFVNEVGWPKLMHSSNFKPVRERRGSLLPDIHESSDFQSVYSVEDVMNEVNAENGERRNSEMLVRRFSLVTEGMRKNSLATMPRKFSLKPDAATGESTGTLDCLDPVALEIKRDIVNIEEEVNKVDYEIDYFLEGPKNLKYYEINERLIRLNLGLSDLECGSEELRKLKKQVQEYIQKCKEKLDSKVV